MTKPKPQIQLGRGEHIVTAVPGTHQALTGPIRRFGSTSMRKASCAQSAPSRSTRLWNNGCYSRWVRRFRGS